MTVRQPASETISLYEIYLSLDKQINYLVDILSYVISSISAHLCKIFAASGRTKNHKKNPMFPKMENLDILQIQINENLVIVVLLTLSYYKSVKY